MNLKEAARGGLWSQAQRPDAIAATPGSIDKVSRETGVPQISVDEANVNDGLSFVNIENDKMSYDVENVRCLTNADMALRNIKCVKYSQTSSMVTAGWGVRRMFESACPKTRLYCDDARAQKKHLRCFIRGSGGLLSS